MSKPKIVRRLPVGAELQPEGVHFRVWAPLRKVVEVVIESGVKVSTELGPESGGYFSGLVREAGANTRYRIKLDGDDYLYPDPASRFQPEGPHGPSQVIDASKFAWTDAAWKGASIENQVIYEMHIGTFTPGGTWASAEQELPELASFGVTVLEIMPIADFPGDFGWGYDGVNIYAPTRLYGEPDDLRHFINRAHECGIAVILDVVYNHFGPDGNYLKQFSTDYFTDQHTTDWGEAINFDGERAKPVREFYLANAVHWIEEYHFDGLRLDATQNIYDNTNPHILAEITKAVRETAGHRATIVVAENEPQETKLARPVARGGYGIDSLWNDDFHHSAMVALTGHNEAYYHDYFGKPQEFISAIKWGYLYQGQYYDWQKQRRGRPGLDLKPTSFMIFIENHDQVANSGRGQRAHQRTSPGRFRAMTMLILLAPGTPMLFQGQEFASSKPFFYFASHGSDLAKLVEDGRRVFLSQFRSLATQEMQVVVPNPADPETFSRSKLDLSERATHREIYDLHRDLLRLRREDPVFRAQGMGGVDGAVLGDEAFVLRFFGDAGDDRLLVINFGTAIRLTTCPEPLLAPPEDMEWNVLISSESYRYGGTGTAQLDTDEGWQLPGQAAVVLTPKAIGSKPTPLEGKK
jgi:maltooligosyltrehalose trehalohydrolase